jgi:hypothetical protein
LSRNTWWYHEMFLGYKKSALSDEETLVTIIYQKLLDYFRLRDFNSTES